MNLNPIVPLYPCREEVLNVLRFIRDCLVSKDIEHTFEQVEENPDCWSVGTVDKAGHANFGLISWNEEVGGVVYVVWNQSRERHDVAEGIPENESKCWWRPRTAEMFIMAMDGRVREVEAKFRGLVERGLDPDDVLKAA